MECAPFFDDVVDGLPLGQAHWVTARDGVRLRIGHWQAENPIGTVLIFPGRTEYVEKYHSVATRLSEAGYCSAAIDWRGQGIADRLTDKRGIGHVGRFSDYQKDVAAMLDHAAALDLPKPYFLLGHSMGGCIGLRALYAGLDVEAVAFTAPMWGIQLSPALRPIAWGLSSVGSALQFGHVLSPGQVETSYVATAPFEDNTLTSSKTVFAHLKNQLSKHPDLALGGPSLHWLGESLLEMHRLTTQPSPSQPAITFLGSRERIVDPGRIRDRMARWPGGKLVMLDNAEHEVLMERAHIADQVISSLISHFETARLAVAAA